MKLPPHVWLGFAEHGIAHDEGASRRASGVELPQKQNRPNSTPATWQRALWDIQMQR